MRDIFISHVEEDARVALHIAEGLEQAGYTTWYYERDSIPGVSYLIQTGQAIENSQAILLLVSPTSVDSHQVSREVERAHDCGKPFLPVMYEITHADFIAKQPMWRQAIGTHTSLSVPRDGVPAILPQVIEGFQGMGVYPRGEDAPRMPTPAQLREEARSTERILQFLGGRVAVTGNQVFVLGFKPSVKGIFGRSAMADECAENIASDRSEFLCLFGQGGIGKSTLAALVFSQFADEGQGEFDRFIWCQIAGDSDPETTLLQLVTIANDGHVPPVGPDVSAFIVLLNLLRTRLAQRPTLVVFDNIDNTFDVSAEAGTFADDRWPELFRAFLGGNSAIIVTSRQVPKFHEPAAEFRRVDGIAQQEGVELMREMGLIDDDRVLWEAYELLQGHPMALSAMAAAVMRRPSYGGRLSRAGDIIDAVRRCPDVSRNPYVLFENVIDPDSLPDAEYALITAMPILLRAETGDAIGALRPELESDDVYLALDELYLRSLMQMDTDADPPLYSLHPLVREVAANCTENPQALHERIFKHYSSLPWNRSTKNPSDVEHLRLAVFHALSFKDILRAKGVLYDEVCLAEMLERWGRYDLLLPVHRQELDVAREVGGDDDRMRAAGLLSRCQIRLGQPSEALVHAEEALEMAVARGDRMSEGDYRGQIGLIHLRTGDFDESLKWLEEALALTLETGDRRREGIFRGYIGEITSKQGDHDNALECLATAHSLAVEIGDRNSEVQWSAAIGHIYKLRGDYDKAIDIMHPALSIAIENGDIISESRLRTSIGQTHMLRGNFSQAQAQFKQSLKLDIEIGNRRHERAVRLLIGQIYCNRGEYDKALDTLEESLKIAIEIGSKLGEAFCRAGFGYVHLCLGDLDRALEHLQFALSFFIEAGNKTNECSCRGRIGEIYLNRQEHEIALHWLQKALELSIEMKDKENESGLSGSIGRVHLEQGNYQEAAEWLDKALQLAIEIDDLLNERVHCSSLGKLHMAIEKPCDAVEYFERALEITSELGMTQKFIDDAKENVQKARLECEGNI